MKDNDLIVMSNQLLESKHIYTELEAKMIFSFASLIQRDDSDFWTYSVQAKDIGTREDLKKSCKTIMQKVIEIDKGNNNWLVLNWFSDIEYKDGLLQASFSPKMKPYMLQLQKTLGFTKMGLSNIINLKSRYLIRLYTLLKKEQYKTIWDVDFKELCEMLQVPKSYLMYKNFKLKILDRLNEINKTTDIFVTATPIKKGKTVVSIKFTIQKDDFENFVKTTREKWKLGYKGKDIILFQNERSIWSLNANGHIEKDNIALTAEPAKKAWRFLYELSLKDELVFKVL